METTEQQRILICSLGSIGKRYARIIKEMWPQCELRALRSGLNKEKCNNIDADFFHEEDAIQWNPNSAIIASPANKHLKQALSLTRARIPTLIEKPIGTGEEDIKELKELEQISRNTPVWVGYILRQDPGATFVKRLIKEERAGAMISARFNCGSWLPDWRSGIDYRQGVSAQKDLGGGATLELSHEIDMALYLLGEIDVVHAEKIHISELEIDTDDQCVIIGRTKAKTLVTIEVDFCTGIMERSVKIRGTKGIIEWDLAKGIVKLKTEEGEHQKNIGISTDERVKRQLKEFWSKSTPSNAKLCSITEGINVHKIIQRVKEYNANLS